MFGGKLSQHILNDHFLATCIVGAIT